MKSAIFLLMITTSSLHTMEHVHDASSSIKQPSMISADVIPGAAYCIYDKAYECTGGVPAQSKIVTFYTFDGEPLERIQHRFRFELMRAKVDSSAPKPRPATCKIVYWFAIPIGYRFRGESGHFAVFYDKHGNAITAHRVSGTCPKWIFSHELDTSDLPELIQE